MGGHLPPWVNTLIIPKFGGGVRNLEGGGADEVSWMYAPGGQQQFHAAHSLYMKVVLRSLNVLNAIVCSSCFWFLSIVRVPFSNIFFRIARYRKDVFLGWALGWRWLKCVDLIQPCPFRIALSTSVFYQTLNSKVLWCQMLSTVLLTGYCRDSPFFTSP